MKKIGVAVLGATGMAGQEYVTMLTGHPYFEIKCLTGKSSVGKRYSQCVQGMDLPEAIAEMEIRATDEGSVQESDLVFSPLPADAARELEPRLATVGLTVVSDSSCHRMEPDVPLVIPDVNPEHLALLTAQKESRHWEGALVTTPNCTTVGLVTALKPIQQRFGIRKVVVTTMQALSGAGYPGVASLDIVDNVIPFIDGEEEKVSSEAMKILGSFERNGIRRAAFTIEASCNRVQTLDGHLESVYIETEKDLVLTDAKRVLSEYRSLPQELGLPTAPASPIILNEGRDRPQPRLDRGAGTVPGMSVVVGRMRQGRESNTFMFTLLCHNRIRGASGSAILLAELMLSRGYLRV